MHTLSKAPGRVAILSLLVTTLVVLLSASPSTEAARRKSSRQSAVQRRRAVKPKPSRTRTTRARPPVGKVLMGRATWYGPGFHGRRTASGERFNRHALTLASRGLPMNTVVRVTNLKNGRSAVGRVNDRGPYAHGAIVDLSEALARRVGMGGIARVKVEVLGWRGQYDEKASAPKPK